MTEDRSMLVTYVGIVGRKTPVLGRVYHPPHVGEHIRLMTFKRPTFDCRYSYYEIVQVQWDVRHRYSYAYRAGEEGEGYLTVFLRPVKGGPGEVFDRAEAAADRERERRRRRGGTR